MRYFICAIGLVATLASVGCWNNDLFQCYEAKDCPTSSMCRQGSCINKKPVGEPQFPKDGGTTDQPSVKPDNANPPKDDVTPDRCTTPGKCPPCREGQARACYDGPNETRGKGECRVGSQTCNQGQWGPCLGMNKPSREICDGKDNNCDGNVDESCSNAFPHFVFGIGTKNEDVATGVVVDSKGDIYIVGMLDSPGMSRPETNESSRTQIGQTVLRPGPFMIKLDPKGNIIWAKAIPSPDGGDRARLGGVAIDSSDHVYVAGNYTKWKTQGPNGGGQPEYYGVMIAKLAPDGNIVWNRKVAQGYSPTVKGFAVTAKGEMAICGSFGFTRQGTSGNQLHFGSVTVVGAGFNDGYVAKVKADGTTAWATLVGGRGFDYCNAVTLDPSGQVYAVGKLQGTARIGDTERKDINAQHSKMFVAKFEQTGKVAWVNTDPTGKLYPEATGVVVDTKGNVTVVGGETEVTTKAIGGFFVAQFDAKGTMQWHNKPKGKASGTAIAIDANGDVVVTGFFIGFMSINGNGIGTTGWSDPYLGHPDFFVAKFKPNGDAPWVMSGGGPDRDYATSVTVTPKGKRTLVLGHVRGKVTFDANTYTSKGYIDVALWHIGPYFAP